MVEAFEAETLNVIEQTPDRLKEVSGIDRVSFTGAEPARTPIIRFAGGRPVMGIGSADFCFTAIERESLGDVARFADQRKSRAARWHTPSTWQSA
jgi:hypothetical protein